ncbi:hypothetical protein AALP_AAs73735U000200 [Arabis alpina]|uniref:Uncharacterized protein n=1 Tax=Arabis alpina TaxID=50452 RepID=A0A087FWG6_ARAAL|nr:hypothetical protein AALP_AAs73735U000200 [Arabis alpina]
MMSPKELGFSLELDPDGHGSNVVDMSVHYGPKVPDGIDADNPIGLLYDFDNLPPKTCHGTDHPSSSHGHIGVTNVMVGNLDTEVTTESSSADAAVRSSGIDDLMRPQVSEVGGPSAAETTSPGSLVRAHVHVATKFIRRGGDVVVVDDDDDVKANDDDVEANEDDIEADDDEDGDEEVDEEIDD